MAQRLRFMVAVIAPVVMMVKATRFNHGRVLFAVKLPRFQALHRPWQARWEDFSQAASPGPRGMAPWPGSSPVMKN